MANIGILEPSTTQNIFHDARYEIMTLIAKSNSNLRKHVKRIELNYGKESPQGQALLVAVKAVTETLCTIDSIKIIAKTNNYTKAQKNKYINIYNDIINGIGELDSFIFRIEELIKVEQKKDSNSVISKFIEKSYIPFLHGVGTHKLAQSSTRTKKPIIIASVFSK